MTEPLNFETEEAFLAYLREEFLKEATQLLEDCDESFLKLEDPANVAEELKIIFRGFHSMKGSGAAVGYDDIAKFAHCAEDLLALLRLKPEWLSQNIQTLLLAVSDALKKRVSTLKSGGDDAWNVIELQREVEDLTAKLKRRLDGVDDVPTDTPPPEPVVAQAPSGNFEKTTTVKVDVERVEGILDLVGELTVLKSQLAHHSVIKASTNLNLVTIVDLIDKTIRELQDKTLGMRLMPLRSLFLKVQRVVRDVSIKLGKNIRFEMEGGETELDRRIVESLADPLIHIVRNALDHGVEDPQARAQSGKPEQAVVRLTARQSSGRVLIEITDDGRGISRAKVFARAEKQGLLEQGMTLETMSNRDIYECLFKPGFSTAEKVTDLSGRGVGLDVAKTNVEKLKGSILIESQEGKGSQFTLSFPLTTAITDGILIRHGERRFIMPISAIREIVSLVPEQKINVDNNIEMIEARGELMPIFRLDKMLFAEDRSIDPSIALVVYDGHRQFSLACEEVLGQTQVVMKSLGNSLDDLPGVAGGAILSDGEVALVLDLEGLAARTFSHHQDVPHAR